MEYCVEYQIKKRATLRAFNSRDDESSGLGRRIIKILQTALYYDQSSYDFQQVPREDELGRYTFL